MARADKDNKFSIFVSMKNILIVLKRFNRKYRQLISLFAVALLLLIATLNIYQTHSQKNAELLKMVNEITLKSTSMQDSLLNELKGDNIKYVEPIDVVKLVVSKMKSVLDAIAVNTKSNVDVKFDQESGTITVKYQQKAEAKVKAYLKAVRDSIPKFITA